MDDDSVGEKLASSIARRALTKSPALLIQAEPGAGKSHMLGSIYDHLQTDHQSKDSVYWPERDSSWVGFPPEFIPERDSSPAWWWLAATCVRAAGAPVPALIGIAEQLKAHGDHLADGAKPLKIHFFKKAKEEALKLTKGVASDMVPGSQTAIAIATMIYTTTDVLLESWRERKFEGVSALVTDRPDLVNEVAETIEVLRRSVPVILAIDNLEDSDPSLQTLISRLVASDSPPTVLATSQLGGTGKGRIESIGIADFETIPLPKMSDSDALKILRKSLPEISPEVGGLIAGHVNRNWSDLVELLPVIRTTPRTADEVELLPRRRSTIAEFAWMGMDPNSQALIGCCAWLSSIGDGVVSARFLQAAEPNADLSIATDGGWIEVLQGGYRVGDVVHKEIASRSITNEDRERWARAVLARFVDWSQLTAPEFSLHLACGGEWLRCEPGPIIADADRLQLRSAAESGWRLTQQRLALGDRSGAILAFRLAAEIAQQIGFSPAEMRNLRTVGAQTLTRAGRIAQAREEWRRLIAESEGLQKSQMEAALKVLEAELLDDPPAAIEMLEQALRDLHEVKEPTPEQPLDAELRLAIAYQRSKSGDFIGAGAIYLGVARDTTAADEAFRQRMSDSGSGPETVLRFASIAFGKAGEGQASVNALIEAVEMAQRFAADSPVEDSLRRDLLWNVMLRLKGGKITSELTQLFDEGLERCGVPTNFVEASATYGRPSEYPTFAVGLAHTGALILLGRYPMAEVFLREGEIYLPSASLLETRNYWLLRCFMNLRRDPSVEGLLDLTACFLELDRGSLQLPVSENPFSKLSRLAAQEGLTSRLIESQGRAASLLADDGEQHAAIQLRLNAASGALNDLDGGLAFAAEIAADGLRSVPPGSELAVHFRLMELQARERLGENIDPNELMKLQLKVDALPNQSN